MFWARIAPVTLYAQRKARSIFSDHLGYAELNDTPMPRRRRRDAAPVEPVRREPVGREPV